MHFPHLRPVPQQRRVIDRFLGLDRRAAIPEGAFAAMRNLSAAEYPLLSVRPRRGLLRTLRSPGGLLAKDALLTVEDGILYIAVINTDGTDTSSEAAEKIARSISVFRQVQ